MSTDDQGIEFEVDVTLADDAAGQAPDVTTGGAVANGTPDAGDGDKRPGLTREQRKQKTKERIDTLTRLRREAERRAEESDSTLAQERQAYKDKEAAFIQHNMSNAKVVHDTLVGQKKLLEAHVKMARDRGDTQAENEAQDALTQVRSKLVNIAQAYPGIDTDSFGIAPQPQAQPQQQQQSSQPQQPAAAAQVPKLGQEWVSRNAFLKGTGHQNAVNSAYYALLAENKDPNSAEFYTEMTARLKKSLPDEIAARVTGLTDDEDISDWFDDEATGEVTTTVAASTQQQQPPAGTAADPVAGAARNSGATAQAGKKKVKLTREQLAFCQRMGVKPEDYARQVAAQQNGNGYTVIGG